jgi:type 1 glutamine amidotransferase
VGGVAHSEATVMAVNWPAGFWQLPSHPVLEGVAPFTVDDRWLPGFKLNGAESVTPLLQADPPDYAHIADEPNPQTLAWLFERPDGGRSFVYGGGHFFETYRDASIRQVITRAILWTARVDVRPRGSGK